jgi:hypothetical protein
MREFKLPPEADSIATRFDADGVHVSMDVVDANGELLETHCYANAEAADE